MRRYRFSDLNNAGSGQHFLRGLLSGARLYKGGLSFHPPNKVTHDEERPHVEIDEEAFCLLQGRGWIEINGVREPVQAGDILIIETGEDHHLISSEEDPLINLWLHANMSGHVNQFSSSSNQERHEREQPARSCCD